MSFLSSQYGWAANNVVNYEVVLANGTVVDANEKEHSGKQFLVLGMVNSNKSDLFAALKGGGNNLGIVTSYKLQTHPISKVRLLHPDGLTSPDI